MGTIKLMPIAEKTYFTNRIRSIFEELNQSYSLVTEEDEDSTKLLPNEKAAMDKIFKTFADAMKRDKSSIESIAKDEKKLDKIEDQHPELKDLADKIEEATKNGTLKEFVISGMLIAGLIAAVPTLIKIFGYLIDGIGSVLDFFGFDDAAARTKRFAKKVINAGQAVHKGYINFIQGAMKYTIPGFAILDDKIQHVIAEIIFIAIVTILGVNAGVEAFNAFSHAHYLHGGVEGLLAAIKAGDIGGWITETIAAIASAGTVAPVAPVA